jgi:hypothetical protein
MSARVSYLLLVLLILCMGELLLLHHYGHIGVKYSECGVFSIFRSVLQIAQGFPSLCPISLGGLIGASPSAWSIDPCCRALAALTNVRTCSVSAPI